MYQKANKYFMPANNAQNKEHEMSQNFKEL